VQAGGVLGHFAAGAMGLAGERLKLSLPSRQDRT
jgi:hypothetical protein